jgi:hypothetical protein
MDVKILVIGRHESIMQTVLRLIHEHPGWSALGALTDEEAIFLFETDKFDLVLLGGGVEASSEQYLRATFATINPKIIIIQHYGGGSGLLSNEIMEALDHRSA